MGVDATPPEENADLPGFTPERAHLLLQGIYGDFPHHNSGSHLDRGIADDAAFQHCWCRLAAQSAIWYATPSGAVGRRFTAILAVEWRGGFSQSWNFERPLVFAHVILTKTLGVYRARGIRAQIIRCMDLWERGQHVGLVGDAAAEGAAREVRAASGGKYEDDSYHDTVLSGKLRQAVRRATDREGAFQHCWCRLAAQSAIWYATPSGAVGRRFTAILTAEWWGILSRSWNSKRPLVFTHVGLTKTLGVRGVYSRRRQPE